MRQAAEMPGAGRELLGSAVRLHPNLAIPTLDFPDTEEVTGSNPVRPTIFFENLSSTGSQMGASHLRIYPLSAGEHDGPDAVLARLPPANVGQIPGLNGPTTSSMRHTADLPVSVPQRPAGSSAGTPRRRRDAGYRSCSGAHPDT